MSSVTVLPGTNKAAEIQTALNSGYSVLLSRDGTYGIEAPILVTPSHNRLGLFCLDGVATFSASFGGAVSSSADTATNAMILVQGTISSASINTILASSSVNDYRQIPLASSANVTSSQWLRIQGNNATDGGPLTMGPSVSLTEIVKVSGSISASGWVSLAAPLVQFHSRSVSVVGCTPVENFTIAGVSFDATNGTMANAVLSDYTTRLTINDCEFRGFSRHCIELRLGTTNFEIARLRSHGEVNSIIGGVSCMRGNIDSVKCDTDGRRYHTYGNPRAAINFRSRCASIKISNCDLKRMCCGLRTWGGTNLHFSDITVDDMDGTRLIARDPEVTNTFGVGVDGGPGPLTIAEFGANISFTNVHCTNCRTPTTVNQYTWFLHDIFYYHITNCSAINGGASPNDVINGETYYNTGIYLKDCTGQVDSFIVRGCNYGLQTEGAFMDMTFNDLKLLGNAADGAVGVAVQIGHAGGPSTSPIFRNLRIDNYSSYVRFTGDWIAGNKDPGLSFDKFTDAFGKVNTNCVVVYNATSSLNTRTLVKFDGTTNGSGVYAIPNVKLPSSGSADGILVVAGPTDVGTGTMMMSLLPVTGRATVTAASGTFIPGDIVKPDDNGRAVWYTSGSSGTPFGKVLLGKTGDVGTIDVGPV